MGIGGGYLFSYKRAKKGRNEGESESAQVLRALKGSGDNLTYTHSLADGIYRNDRIDGVSYYPPGMNVHEWRKELVVGIYVQRAISPYPVNCNA